jgi:hypothetical protein
LPAGDATGLAAHLRECDRCSAEVESEAAPLAASLRAFVDADEHPDIETYVDGALTSEERVLVEEHLEECAICREDVDDLRGVRDRMQRRARPSPWWLAAAAAAAMAVFLWQSQRVDEPAVRTTTKVSESKPARPAGYGRADWDRLVADARAGGAMAMPAALRELQADPDTLRGGAATRPGARFTPAGEIVASTRPEMRWPPVEGARYVVAIFHEDRRVARSELLTSASWTPPKPLARGTTYEWQVEIHRGEETTTAPEPPDPPAIFAVLDAATAAAVDEARGRFPDDYFLAGLLYARAGVRESAIAELGVWLAAHPGDRRAAEILASIRRW